MRVLQNLKALGRRIELSALGALASFWLLADKVTKRERASVVVEVRSMGKQISINVEHIAGLRLGYAYPNSKTRQCLVNGRTVNGWHKLKASDQVTVVLRPEGGLIGDIVSAVVGVALILSGNPALANIGIGLLVSAGTSVLSKLLFPVPKAEGAAALDATEAQPEITGAKNTVSKSVVPVLLGKTKITPYYGQRPYRLVGDGTATNVFYQYFIPTYENVTVEKEKLGETLVNDYPSEYLTIQRSFGGAFIGNDNIKVVQKDETLTYDAEGAVSQSATVIYSQTQTASSLQFDFKVTFTNVDIANFANKEFTVDIDVLDDTPEPLVLSHVFVVTDADIVLDSGTTYYYEGTHTFTQDITEIVSSNFYPNIQTRGNTQENDNLLEVVINTQEVTAGAFNLETLLEEGLNFYEGLLSQSLSTSPEGTTDIDLIFSFPSGLFTQNDNGSRNARGVGVTVEYKEEGGSYQALDTATLYVRQLDGTKGSLAGSSTVVSGSKATFYSPNNINSADELFFRTIGLELPEGQYTVRVRSADLFDKSDKDIGFIKFAEVNYHVSGDVLNESNIERFAQYNIKANAHKQLSGELNEFNFVGTSQVPDWNGSAWIEAVTENPASAIRYLLTDGNANPRAESVSVIDNDSLVELHEWCEAKGYKVSGLISEPTRILNIIESILGNCQASFTISEGKYKFVIDDDAKPALNQITPHNSFNFKWTPTLGKTTDAVRVAYIDGVTYTEDEFTLYYYDGDVHEAPKAGTGDENYEIIKQDAEYTKDETHLKALYTENLKTLQEKRNLFEFDVNLEGLTLSLYDRIYVANSVNMKNSSSGLIKEVLTSSGNITGFKLYSKVTIESGSVITIRSIDAANSQMIVQNFDVTNSGLTDVVYITPVVYNGIIKGKSTLDGFGGAQWQYDGDIFEVGQNSLTKCVVLNIRYKEDLTATITAREA